MAPLLGDWLKPLWKLQSLEASSSGSVTWSSAITDTQSICMWGNVQWDVKDWTHERTRSPSLCPLNVTQARPPLDLGLGNTWVCESPVAIHTATTTQQQQWTRSASTDLLTELSVTFRWAAARRTQPDTAGALFFTGVSKASLRANAHKPLWLDPLHRQTLSPGREWQALAAQ